MTAYADVLPHHRLLGPITMVSYFTFCPGNVILVAAFDMYTTDKISVLAGAVLNGALYTLLGYGLSHVQAKHKWTRPAYALAAFSVWLGITTLL